MARKHMASFWCMHCWLSCNTRQKAEWHLVEMNCRQRGRPSHERFMDPLHEPQVENTSRTASAEDIWWAMFRLLIPGVGAIDDSVLRSRYSPCKVPAWRRQVFSSPPSNLYGRLRSEHVHEIAQTADDIPNYDAKRHVVVHSCSMGLQIPLIFIWVRPCKSYLPLLAIKTSDMYA